jgi:hypothetical protein
MKTRYRYIIAFIVLALVAAVIIWKYTFRPSGTDVAAEKADVIIDAAGLLQSFETNEAEANTLYLGKILIVTGTVESVSEDTLGISVYLKSSDAVAGVICSFDKKNPDVQALEKGTPASIKGICTGYLLDVVLNKCSIEPPVN